MTWVLASLVILVLAAAAVVGTGRWGAMPELVDDRPAGWLPDGPVTAEDLLATRFTVVPRGYSMAEVDELVQRLAAQLPSAHESDDDKAVDGPVASVQEAGQGVRRTTGKGLFEA